VVCKLGNTKPTVPDNVADEVAPDVVIMNSVTVAGLPAGTLFAFTRTFVTIPVIGPAAGMGTFENDTWLPLTVPAARKADASVHGVVPAQRKIVASVVPVVVLITLLVTGALRTAVKVAVDAAPAVQLKL
jgi:hypothetical protein